MKISVSHLLASRLRGPWCDGMLSPSEYSSNTFIHTTFWIVYQSFGLHLLVRS